MGSCGAKIDICTAVRVEGGGFGGVVGGMGAFRGQGAQGGVLGSDRSGG